MKIIYSGLESSGKSLRLAMMAERILFRNYRWKKRTGIVRPIYSNMRFSEKFTALATKLGIPIYYWENIDDIVLISNADIFIDEVGNYFDARMWQDLSQDARRWVTQGAKAGVEVYGAAQDFAQVDIVFRRLTNYLYHITKIIGSPRPANTKPPVRWIWGLCWKASLNPRAYDEDKKKFVKESLLTSILFFWQKFFLIRRHYCEIFDTSQVIKKSKPPAYKHVLRICELHGTGCDYERIQHA
jgi:hypothetical protein